MNGKFDFKGIRFKTLMFFCLFAFIILGLLWLLEVVFLESFYQGMKKGEIERTGRRVVNSFGTDNFDTMLRETAMKNNMDILVFYVQDLGAQKTIWIMNSSSDFNFHPEQQQQLTQTLERFLGSFDNNKTVTSYIEKGQAGLETMVYGEIMDISGTQVYVYTNSLLEPIDSTVSVLTTQLMMITAICLVLTIVMSVVMSNKISKPIVDITAGARKLARGDFDAQFDGSGFSEAETLAETLDLAANELKKTDELRRDLISNVSHELRTPLTMIKAYTEMIMDISGGDEVKRNEHLAVILEETDRLKNLVNDILDLSKLQAGVVEYDRHEFDLSSAVKKTAASFAGIFERDGYTFGIDVDDGITVNADEARIEQVIYNLLANAVNYSSEKKRVEVRLKSSNGAARLDVIDSGVGIPEEEIPHIFDRFFRADKAKKSHSGSGIGLSIVKSILEGHGYGYGVSSKPEVGSDFYVIFTDGKTV